LSERLKRSLKLSGGWIERRLDRAEAGSSGGWIERRLAGDTAVTGISGDGDTAVTVTRW